VFLVGGKGKRRCEPLSYDALVRMFARAADRAGVRDAWLTPHSLRHTHATRMFEGGMRELTLMTRLGHATPDSMKVYTGSATPRSSRTTGTRPAEARRDRGPAAKAVNGRPRSRAPPCHCPAAEYTALIMGQPLSAEWRKKHLNWHLRFVRAYPDLDGMA
jgi:hypothetical protein